MSIFELTNAHPPDAFEWHRHHLFRVEGNTVHHGGTFKSSKPNMSPYWFDLVGPNTVNMCWRSDGKDHTYTLSAEEPVSFRSLLPSVFPITPDHTLYLNITQLPNNQPIFCMIQRPLAYIMVNGTRIIEGKSYNPSRSQGFYIHDAEVLHPVETLSELRFDKAAQYERKKNFRRRRYIYLECPRILFRPSLSFDPEPH